MPPVSPSASAVWILSAIVLLTAFGRQDSVIKVAIVATGDVGQYAGMCGSHTGLDSLTGKLKLTSLDKDGSAFYEGTLSRRTKVEACGTKPSPTEDQVTWCFATLTGAVDMLVTLEIYEGDRGAWVKSKPVGAPTQKGISGCPEPSEWLNRYPNDGMMSGLPIDDVPSGPLAAPQKYGTPELTLEVIP